MYNKLTLLDRVNMNKHILWNKPRFYSCLGLFLKFQKVHMLIDYKPFKERMYFLEF